MASALRLLNLSSLAIAALLGFTAGGFELSDIGFKGTDFHLGIELTPKNSYKFLLRSNQSGKSVALSSCAYTEESLAREIGGIESVAVRADFKWIFFRSGYSAASMESFYPEFIGLLKRARPECAVKDLQVLKDELSSKAG